MDPHKVLVALDGSAPSQRALQWALARGQRAHDEVWAPCVLDTRQVMVAARVPARGADEVASYGERLERPLESASSAAASAGTSLHKALRPSSDPAGTILAFAREGGLAEIVLGHRAKSGVEPMVLGSTALRIAELAPMPVTVVKT